MSQSDPLFEYTEPQPRIYKSNAIRIGTFIGGPLVAGYLIAENYKAFDDYKKAKTTWIVAILSTVLLLGATFLIPDSVPMPKMVIPIAYSWLVFYLVKNLQGADIDEHIKTGGPVFSWWRIIGVGMLGTVITLALIFAIVLVVGV
jgi:peptidoglycan/LPS O-acetylase OafA/YrhL